MQTQLPSYEHANLGVLEPHSKTCSSLIDQLMSMNAALLVADVADILNCSLQMVYKMVHKGMIPHFRLGTLVRFDPKVLAEWLRQRSLTTKRKPN